MNELPVFSPNPPIYYHNVASYYELVQPLAQELNGFSIADYREWYIAAYLEFYSFRYLTNYSPILYYKGWKGVYRFSKIRKGYSPPPQIKASDEMNMTEMDLSSGPKSRITAVIEEAKTNPQKWPLPERGPINNKIRLRLLRSRVMRRVYYYFNLIDVTGPIKPSKRFEDGYYSALDKRMYLAMQLKEIAEDLLIYVPHFHYVKANSTRWNTNYYRFNPVTSPDHPVNVLAAMGRMQAFKAILNRYNQEIENTYPNDAAYDRNIPSNISLRNSEGPRQEIAQGPANIITIDMLCMNQFSKTDMDELLLHLNVIQRVETADSTIRYQIKGGRKPMGKAKGMLSAFPAAFGVLERENFFSSNRNEWAIATLAAYGVVLTEKGLNYEVNGTPNITGSIAFDRYTEKSEKWLERWKTKNLNRNPT